MGKQIKNSKKCVLHDWMQVDLAYSYTLAYFNSINEQRCPVM
jgi:hypothetical protein